MKRKNKNGPLILLKTEQTRLKTRQKKSSQWNESKWIFFFSPIHCIKASHKAYYNLWHTLDLFWVKEVAKADFIKPLLMQYFLLFFELLFGMNENKNREQTKNKIQMRKSQNANNKNNQWNWTTEHKKYIQCLSAFQSNKHCSISV